MRSSGAVMGLALELRDVDRARCALLKLQRCSTQDRRWGLTTVTLHRVADPRVLPGRIEVTALVVSVGRGEVLRNRLRGALTLRCYLGSSLRREEARDLPRRPRRRMPGLSAGSWISSSVDSRRHRAREVQHVWTLRDLLQQIRLPRRDDRYEGRRPRPQPRVGLGADLCSSMLRAHQCPAARLAYQSRSSWSPSRSRRTVGSSSVVPEWDRCACVDHRYRCRWSTQAPVEAETTEIPPPRDLCVNP